MSSSQDFRGQTGERTEGAGPAAPGSALHTCRAVAAWGEPHITPRPPHREGPQRPSFTESPIAPQQLPTVLGPGWQPALPSVPAQPGASVKDTVLPRRPPVALAWWTHRRTHWVCRRLTRAGWGTPSLTSQPHPRGFSAQLHSYRGHHSRQLTLRSETEDEPPKPRPPGLQVSHLQVRPCPPVPPPLPLPRPRTSMKSGMPASWVGERVRGRERRWGAIEKHPPPPKPHLGSPAATRSPAPSSST